MMKHQRWPKEEYCTPVSPALFDSEHKTKLIKIALHLRIALSVDKTLHGHSFLLIHWPDSLSWCAIAQSLKGLTLTLSPLNMSRYIGE